MNMTDPRPMSAILLRRLAGYVVQYFASGLLVPTLLLCFAALVFCQLALLGPDVGWLGHLLNAMPDSVRALFAGTTSAAGDVHLEAIIARVFWGLSLGVMVLELLSRGLAAALSGKASAPAGARRRSSRRALVALVLVSAVFAAALLTVPHARMAHGSSHAGLYAVFAILYLVAVGFALLWAGLNGVAARLLDATSR